MVKNKVHGQTSSSPMYPGLWECRSRPRDWMSAKSMAGIISPLSVINIKIWLDTDLSRLSQANRHLWICKVPKKSLGFI